MCKTIFFLILLVVPVFSNVVATSDCTLEAIEVEKEILCEDDVALLLLKRWEGLLLTPKWDVNAYRIGWGTKSESGERLTLQEADKRVKSTFNRVRNKIAKKYPKLDNWETAIFSVMAYNVGTFGTRLDTALQAGDVNTASKVMLLYVNSGGEKLQGLENRRRDEHRLLTSCPEDRTAIILELTEIVNKHIQNNKHG